MCGPFLGIAPVLAGRYPASWAANCVHFNESVISYVSSRPHITHVVLASLFDQYLRPRESYYLDGEIVRQHRQIAVQSMVSTVVLLRKHGKRVVIIAPIPSTGADIGLCNERRMADLPVLGMPTDCAISRGVYMGKEANVLEFLKEIERVADVPVLWPGDLLCAGDRCATRLDGRSIYSDSGHLSEVGSKRFARHFDLDDKILEFAR
jgi:hypothetical protein